MKSNKDLHLPQQDAKIHVPEFGPLNDISITKMTENISL